MRKAFTLIELMVSIAILSIIMIFLYKSYAELNLSNKIYSKKIEEIQKIELIKKVIYLDFTLSKYKSVNIINQEKVEDTVLFETTNSIHNRINPYVAYIVKDKKLYRLESLKPLLEYPLVADSEFVSDFLGEVKSFRVYKAADPGKEKYLVAIDFEAENDILLKIKALNEL
jgi:prepilin-type N-terminal cleavage/methylation domain-containing protein